MSNQNQKPQDVNGEGTANGEKQVKEKKSIIGKILKTRDRIMASKLGRGIVRGLKVAGVGGIAYASFRAGKKSVVPTTVYIKEGVTEEEPVETNETESAKEETGEVTE